MLLSFLSLVFWDESIDLKKRGLKLFHLHISYITKLPFFVSKESEIFDEDPAAPSLVSIKIGLGLQGGGPHP